MKRIVYTLSLCLGILCFSCESKQNSDNTTLKRASENKEISTPSKKVTVTKKPDTIIDGKQVYNFGKENIKPKTMSLEESIKEFEQGVKNANSCEELIKTCARFDTRIKQLQKSNSSINIIEVEKRDDVRAIRKQSEEKSLKLCQTQQMR